MESGTLQIMQGKRLEREKVRQQLRIQKLTRRRALQFQPLLDMRDEEYQAHRQQLENARIARERRDAGRLYEVQHRLPVSQENVQDGQTGGTAGSASADEEGARYQSQLPASVTHFTKIWYGY